MTVILFLVDNSPSMNQRTYFGPSLLDFCKASIETFYKIRSSKTRLDQYFISTLDPSPSFIKLAGWKQNLDSRKLSLVLEKIKCTGCVSLEVGILRCFNLLNLNRLQLGYENYGFGLYPSYSEPAVVICITHETTTSANLQALNLDNQNSLLASIPGEEFSQSLYRWDYRLFSLSLSIPGLVDNVKEFKHPSIGDLEESVLSDLIRGTGGEKYFALDSRSLQVSLEKLSDKCQSGVIVNFVLRNLQMKQFVHVRQRGKMIGSTWPFPDLSWFSDTIVTGSLPPRPVQPSVYVSSEATDAPDLKETLPYDRYELEPSHLTNIILEKRDCESIWECSSVHPVSQAMCPFAFLRASSDLQSVHLFVLPFNYPVLLKLFNEVNFVMKIPEVWINRVQEYLNDIPRYYLIPLAKLFERLGLQNLIRQDFIDKILPYQIKHNLQKLRQTAKVDYERFVQIVENCCLEEQRQLHVNNSQIKVPLQNGNVIDVNQLSSYRYPLRQEIFHKVFLDPCEAPRGYLRELLPKMRKNLLSILKSRAPLKSDNSNMFNQPISEMGDYMNYKFRSKEDLSPTLREIEPSPERAETFGNPFKKKSSHINTSFVIDEGFVGEAALVNHPNKKKNHDNNSQYNRTKGPIPSEMNAKNWRNWTKNYGIASPYHNSFDSSGNSLDSLDLANTTSDSTTSDHRRSSEKSDNEAVEFIQLVRQAEELIRRPDTDHSSLFDIVERISRASNEASRNGMIDYLTSVALVYRKYRLVSLIRCMKTAKKSPVQNAKDVLAEDDTAIIHTDQEDAVQTSQEKMKRKSSAPRIEVSKAKLIRLGGNKKDLTNNFPPPTIPPNLQRTHPQKIRVNGSH